MMFGGIPLVVSMAAFGQSAQGAPNPGGPEANSTIGKDANYATLQEHQRGGLTFTGKVVMQDAPFPWDPIPIVVTCKGTIRYRTEADAKGGFMIQGNVAASELVETKASINQVSASKLIGCDISAAVPGFKSTTLHISNQDIMDNPDLGTITIRPDSSAAASTTSASTVSSSKDAVKRYEKARAEWLNKNTESAEKDLEKAVQIDPKYADAWYELGKMQQANNKLPDALNSYKKAAEADPKFIAPYQRIAELSAMNKQWQDTVNATSAALKLDPTGTPQLWYFDAVGNLNLGNADAAETSARKSLAMDPQHTAPNTEQLLAVILAGKGEYAEALTHLQNSLTYIKPGPNADLIRQQIAQLEKVVPQGSGQN
jgi:tetratricopeptide (TPR) repeat protein